MKRNLLITLTATLVGAITAGAATTALKKTAGAVTDNTLPRFSGTTGEMVETSGVRINDNDELLDAVLDGDLLTFQNIAAASFKDADWGAFSVTGGVFTIDPGVITPTMLANGSFGGFSVTGGVVTLTGLATVASSGSYNDLDDLPTLSEVATTGSYNDLSDRPTAATYLTAIKTVDGAGSGLDADTLDGASSTAFVLAGTLAPVAASGSYDDLDDLPTLGTAAATDAGDYATDGQGLLAETAVQPGTVVRVGSVPQIVPSVHAAGTIDRALAGATPPQALWSTVNHTGAGTYVWNTAAWTAGFDLTCIAVYNSGTATYGNQGAAIAIAPDVVILAHHFTASAANGVELRFVTQAGASVARTILSSAQVGSTDIRVALLSSPLPATITPARLLPDSYAESLNVAELPVLYADQERKALVSELSGLTTFVEGTGTRADWYEDWVAGDSGAPVMALLDGAPVWVGSAASAPGTFSAGMGNTDAIITAIDGLAGGDPVAITLPPAQLIPWENIIGTVNLPARSTIPVGASPVTGTFGEIAGKIDAWASGRGAAQWFDGTADTYLLGALASDTPSNGEFPMWNTNGTITWETPSGAGIGDVTGPASSGNGYLPMFSGTSGKVLSQSNVYISGGNLYVDNGLLGAINSTGEKSITLEPGFNRIQFYDYSGAGSSYFVFPIGGQTVTGPSQTSTLATLALTETFTNKTYASAILSGTVTGTYTLGGTPSIAAGAITSGTFANARIAESNVTQHEGALTISTAQISDLPSYQASSAKLTSLAAITYPSNALKVVRVNAAEDNFEVATLSGGGDALVAGTLDQFADVVQSVGAELTIADDTTLNGGTHSGTNTGDNAVNSNYSGLVTNATHTGDATGATALTLATVNGNVGSFGSATAAPTFTVNGKGLVTAAGSATITPAIGNVTGLGTGIAAALAVNTGTAGAPVLVGAERDAFVVAISDETTAITTGTAKVTFRMPYAATVTGVRLSLTTVSSSGLPTIDINEAGTTILSTKLTCDASEKSSTTAATAAVVSDTALADDSEITIDIDVAGTGATGAKVTIIHTH